MGFIYKGYLRRSKSVYLAESNRWSLEVTIVWKDSETEMKEQTFSSENTSPAKEVADIEGTIFAKKSSMLR
jgi:hypothetical protein